ncbi:UNVERIFIED_CONTAM: ATP synthase subunit d, mitochondrial [Sesamum radiatum]|uniref:ATP synthase subunit d, mitochondrial n=1 Tax=Sesamum radiatum TaxID=300843 RepID=A0AAW2JKX2_SESRA
MGWRNTCSNALMAEGGIKRSEPEPIDWEYYRKGIGSRLVDMYKQAYDEVKIPKYVDNVTPQYKPKFDALVR